MRIVERLKGLIAEATPAPWFASPYRGCKGSQVWAGEPGPDTATLICGDGDADDANATLIAEAVNALPTLLALLEQAEAALEECFELACDYTKRETHARSEIAGVVRALLAKLHEGGDVRGHR